ncbi:hypothetical protein K1W69_01925 [Hoeflea sp. WL0058]|uniref:Uncharacterized protein n=1 Tax=Flavimaribacter sediminis TaxID=2865987 RepID=A0AAE2ZMB3_9HYPH|nr:hypothetical protein [Flavimaribacter sediminis]MBW8635927.1 hypothetical protein [Flavimaribacter sediminis]
MPVQLTLTCVGAMFALPFVILYLLRKPKPYVLFFLNFLINTVLVLAVVATYDWYLVQHLNSFDLNGDGIFSGPEINPQ